MDVATNVFNGVTGYEYLTTDDSPNVQEGKLTLGATGFGMCVSDEMYNQIVQAQNSTDGKQVSKLLQFRDKGPDKHEMYLKWPEKISMPELSNNPYDGSNPFSNTKVEIPFERCNNLLNRGLALAFRDNSRKVVSKKVTGGAQEQAQAINDILNSIKNYEAERIKPGATLQSTEAAFNNMCDKLKISNTKEPNSVKTDREHFRNFMDSCCLIPEQQYRDTRIMSTTNIAKTWQNFAYKLEKNEALIEVLRESSPSKELSEKVYSDNISMLNQMDKLCQIDEHGKGSSTFTLTECGVSAMTIDNMRQALKETKVKNKIIVAIPSDIDGTPEEKANKVVKIPAHVVGVLGTLADGRVITTEAFAPNKDVFFQSPGATEKIHFGVYKDRQSVIDNYQNIYVKTYNKETEPEKHMMQELKSCVTDKDKMGKSISREKLKKNIQIALNKVFHKTKVSQKELQSQEENDKKAALKAKKKSMNKTAVKKPETKTTKGPSL